MDYLWTASLVIFGLFVAILVIAKSLGGGG
jgi:hypothetical protein